MTPPNPFVQLADSIVRLVRTLLGLAVHDVDEIVYSIQKQVDRLTAAAQHHMDAADDHMTAAMDHNVAANAAQDQAVKALSIIDKLHALIS